MTRNKDVVIVGGGAAGCAAAYYLALAGVKSVIIEREGIASQASGFSAGGLNPLQGTGIPGPLAAVAMESFRMHQELWPVLESETGIDYQWRIISLINAAFDESEVTDLQETAQVFSANQGFEAQLLDAGELLELEPRISPEVIKGVVARGNACVDSYNYTLALVQAAEKLGASVRSGAVRGLEQAHGRVTGVLLEDTVIPCDQVVIATGPWSRHLEPWIDSYVPVDPLKGEILRVELPSGGMGHDVSGGGGSLYAKPDGQVWCGSTEDWVGYDQEPSESAKHRIVKGAIKLVPEMAQAKLVLHTACLRPVTPDWLPIIGRAPGLDNVYLATGAGKKGILLSPAIGKAIADVMVSGSTKLSVQKFEPSRFVAP